MRIALIRRNYAATGGAELYLSRLIAALAAAGHELHLFAEAWPQADTPARLHLIPPAGSRATRPLHFAQSVRDLLQAESFDCVFSLERTLSQDVYRAGDGVHAAWLERRKDFAPWWKKTLIGRESFHRNMMALERQTFNPANTRRIIVNSEMVRREIEARFHFPPDRIHLVRNGVEVARFQQADRAAARARWNLLDNEFAVLFVGSGWERKGLKYLLDAIRFLPSEKYKLLVAGTGRKPARVPHNVRFLGAMEDVEQVYAAADLFVFLPIYEPSANVCIEALAAGLPVVTTVSNGAAELIDDKINGSVLRDPRDVRDVIGAIEYWATQRRRIAISPETVSLEHNVAETLKVLELAARERKS